MKTVHSFMHAPNPAVNRTCAKSRAGFCNVSLIENIMSRTFTLLLFSIFIAGCAAIGPVDSPDFPQMVAKSVPKADGEIRFYGSGNWYPNTRGFTTIRSALLAGHEAPIPGVLVVTSDTVLFQQWEEETKAFDIVKRLPFTELTSAALDTYGLNRRIVLRKKDLSYESFDFTQANGNFIDATKAEEAIAFLRDRIKP
jgi:hypothetical protein